MVSRAFLAVALAAYVLGKPIKPPVKELACRDPGDKVKKQFGTGTSSPLNELVSPQGGANGALLDDLDYQPPSGASYFDYGSSDDRGYGPDGEDEYGPYDEDYYGPYDDSEYLDGDGDEYGDNESCECEAPAWRPRFRYRRPKPCRGKCPLKNNLLPLYTPDDDGVLKCPEHDGRLFKTASGNLFKVECYAEYASKTMKTQTETSLDACLNSCSKVRQCRAVIFKPDEIDGECQLKFYGGRSHKNPFIMGATLVGSQCVDGFDCERHNKQWEKERQDAIRERYRQRLDEEQEELAALRKERNQLIQQHIDVQIQEEDQRELARWLAEEADEADREAYEEYLDWQAQYDCDRDGQYDRFLDEDFEEETFLQQLERVQEQKEMLRQEIESERIALQDGYDYGYDYSSDELYGGAYEGGYYDGLDYEDDAAGNVDTSNMKKRDLAMELEPVQGKLQRRGFEEGSSILPVDTHESDVSLLRSGAMRATQRRARFPGRAGSPGLHRRPGGRGRRRRPSRRPGRRRPQGHLSRFRQPWSEPSPAHGYRHSWPGPRPAGRPDRAAGRERWRPYQPLPQPAVASVPVGATQEQVVGHKLGLEKSEAIGAGSRAAAGQDTPASAPARAAASKQDKAGLSKAVESSMTTSKAEAAPAIQQPARGTGNGHAPTSKHTKAAQSMKPEVFGVNSDANSSQPSQPEKKASDEKMEEAANKAPEQESEQEPKSVGRKETAESEEKLSATQSPEEKAPVEAKDGQVVVTSAQEKHVSPMKAEEKAVEDPEKNAPSAPQNPGEKGARAAEKSEDKQEVPGAAGLTPIQRVPVPLLPKPKLPLSSQTVSETVNFIAPQLSQPLSPLTQPEQGLLAATSEVQRPDPSSANGALLSDPAADNDSGTILNPEPADLPDSLGNLLGPQRLDPTDAGLQPVQQLPPTDEGLTQDMPAKEALGQLADAADKASAQAGALVDGEAVESVRVGNLVGGESVPEPVAGRLTNHEARPRPKPNLQPVSMEPADINAFLPFRQSRTGL